LVLLQSVELASGLNSRILDIEPSPKLAWLLRKANEHLYENRKLKGYTLV